MEEIDDPGVFNKGFAPRWLSITSYGAPPRRISVLKLYSANAPSATNNACETNNNNDNNQEGSTPWSCSDKC